MFGTWHIICHLILVNLYGVVNLAFGTDASECELIQIRDHLEISSAGVEIEKSIWWQHISRLARNLSLEGGSPKVRE